MANSLIIRVMYPVTRGRIVLYSDQDWNRRIEATTASDDGTTHEFQLAPDEPTLYFKPCLVVDDDLQWSQGDNFLAIADPPEIMVVFPRFNSGADGTITAPLTVPSNRSGFSQQVRVYLPPGYDENTVARYPVVYMHDGANLFFREEAFAGNAWRIEDTLALLDSMNLIQELIVVGIYASDRNDEYTKPGYEAYGQFIVEDLKPWIDGRLRTMADAENTAVMGSSLGGVVSLYLAWQWPHVFGKAACLSSTFGFRDDLMQRIAGEAKRDVVLYIDSGWPHDNYESGRAVRDLLIKRGYRPGQDLLYFAFPDEQHNEQFWASRVHIPLEFFFGTTPRFLP